MGGPAGTRTYSRPDRAGRSNFGPDADHGRRRFFKAMPRRGIYDNAKDREILNVRGREAEMGARDRAGSTVEARRCSPRPIILRGVF